MNSPTYSHDALVLYAKLWSKLKQKVSILLLLVNIIRCAFMLLQMSIKMISHLGCPPGSPGFFFQASTFYIERKAPNSTETSCRCFKFHLHIMGVRKRTLRRRAIDLHEVIDLVVKSMPLGQTYIPLRPSHI
jgi:hypothetical protein